MQYMHVFFRTLYDFAGDCLALAGGVEHLAYCPDSTTFWVKGINLPGPLLRSDSYPNRLRVLSDLPYNFKV